MFDEIILAFILTCVGSTPSALEMVTKSPVIIKLPFLTAATLLFVDEELCAAELSAELMSSCFESSLSFFSVTSALTELTPPVILLTPPLLDGLLVAFCP